MVDNSRFTFWYRRIPVQTQSPFISLFRATHTQLSFSGPDFDPLLFHSGNIWVDGLIMVRSHHNANDDVDEVDLPCGLLYPWPLHDEIWTCAKFAICKLLFVSSAFANLFFMWVSGSWASLFSRASENDYGAHHTTTTTTSLPGRVEKFTWQKHSKIQMHSLQNTLGRYCQKPLSLSQNSGGIYTKNDI